MAYHLNRGLFKEIGPTVLAERTREALAVSHAYRLLGGAPRAPGKTSLSAAA